jgi:hypothetical protein
MRQKRTTELILFFSRELNVSASANFEDDTAAMLESLHELFQEHGDKVTARQIAERI